MESLGPSGVIRGGGRGGVILAEEKVERHYISPVRVSFEVWSKYSEPIDGNFRLYSWVGNESV